MKIEIVDFSEDFLNLSWLWLNDPLIKKLTNTPVITKQAQEAWFTSLPSITNYEIWGINADNIPIGACGLKNITSTECEYWGYIGNKGYWGFGVGSVVLSKLIEIAKQKKLKKIWLKVLDNNFRAIKLYNKFGFRTVENFDDKQIRMELIL